MKKIQEMKEIMKKAPKNLKRKRRRGERTRKRKRKAQRLKDLMQLRLMGMLVPLKGEKMLMIGFP